MSRFKINGDGTVTDTKTQLMWSQDDATPEHCDHAAAERACAGLGLAGHKDWRLPDPHELQSIVDYIREDPASDITAFPDCKSSWYWTATKGAWPSGLVWVVDFKFGVVDYYHRFDGAYVRAVRSVSRAA